MKSIWMVAAALAMATGSVGKADEQSPLYLVAEFRDGSVVVGHPKHIKQLAFKCVLGRVNVPVNQIDHVEMQDDGEWATITTKKGDQLQGHFEIGELKLQTEKGPRRVALKKIARWHYDSCANVGNVALSSNGSTVDGPTSHPQNLLDGKTTGYHGTRGWTRSLTPTEWIVTLPQKYPLQQIRLLLYDRDSRSFRYTIETSADGRKYEMVADHSSQWSRSWQILACPGRPVRYIRLRGLDSTYNERDREDGFFVVELEAYCRPPQPPFTGNSLSRQISTGSGFDSGLEY